mgnify:CR=1 FL=1
MTNTYYECHITIESTLPNKETIKKHVEKLKWKFSAIDGDIVMGDGVKYYATRHYNSRNKVEDIITILVETAQAIKDKGYKVTRRKVELVLFDDRSSKVVPCNGACIECHLEDYANV